MGAFLWCVFISTRFHIANTGVKEYSHTRYVSILYLHVGTDGTSSHKVEWLYKMPQLYNQYFLGVAAVLLGHY